MNAASQRLFEAIGAALVLWELGGAQPRVGSEYAIEAIVGAGGFGLICRAFHVSLRRRVALKLYPLGGEGDPGVREALREARSLARLEHPGVVAVYAAGEGELVAGERLPCAFVEMQFVEGQTLRDWLLEARPAVGEVLRVLLACGRALAYAHGCGVVHRDFKPENVMVDRLGRARVIDFGLALAGEQPGEQEGEWGPVDALGTRATGTGLVRGTPGYIAPEASQGRPRAASDQFALAVVLREALTGRHPFDPGEAEAGAEPPEGGPALFERLRPLVDRAMAPSPGDRFPDVGALCEAIEAAVATPGARPRWPLALAGALALGGVGAAAFAWLGGAPAEGAESEFARTAANSEGSAGDFARGGGSGDGASGAGRSPAGTAGPSGAGEAGTAGAGGAGGGGTASAGEAGGAASGAGEAGGAAGAGIGSGTAGAGIGGGAAGAGIGGGTASAGEAGGAATGGTASAGEAGGAATGGAAGAGAAGTAGAGMAGDTASAGEAGGAAGAGAAGMAGSWGASCKELAAWSGTWQLGGQVRWTEYAYQLAWLLAYELELEPAGCEVTVKARRYRPRLEGEARGEPVLAEARVVPVREPSGAWKLPLSLAFAGDSRTYETDEREDVVLVLDRVDGRPRVRGGLRRVDGEDNPIRTAALLASRELAPPARTIAGLELDCASRCRLECAGGKAEAACVERACQPFAAADPTDACGPASAEFTPPLRARAARRTLLRGQSLLEQSLSQGSGSKKTLMATCAANARALAGRWTLWRTDAEARSDRLDLMLTVDGCRLSGTASAGGESIALAGEVTAAGTWTLAATSATPALAHALVLVGTGPEAPAFGVDLQEPPRKLRAQRAR